PKAPGSKRLTAHFAGTLAYLPSHAVGVLAVSGRAPAAPPPRGSPTRPGTNQPAVRPAPKSAPVQAPAAAQQAAPAAQAAQAQAQAQAHAQAQQQVQAVVVPQVQEQLQLGYADNGRSGSELSMRRYQPHRRRQPYDVAAPLLLGATAVAFGVALTCAAPVVATARTRRPRTPS
ncbi:MAG: hypothetical protein LC640_04990, partial [Frankia sp.]|nr:hypothetical protein [Frankia sp.]